MANQQSMSNSSIPAGAWLIRGGINDELVTAFQKKGAIALDWPDVGDLALIPSLDEFKSRVFQKFLGSSPEYIRDELQHLLWFMRLIAVGDYALIDNKRTEEVIIGKVISTVEYNVRLFGANYPYVRRVQWIKPIARDLFTPEAQQDLYSILPIEDIRSHRREIHKQVTGEEGDLEEAETFEANKDIDVLKALVRELAWESEEFLESVLDIIFRGRPNFFR
ncbi:MAG TPA: hypothetical protein VJM08_10705 [Anaerolineales bacterium]|nr:hypothetical protein [Anaerolineales bacterium]